MMTRFGLLKDNSQFGLVNSPKSKGQIPVSSSWLRLLSSMRGRKGVPSFEFPAGRVPDTDAVWARTGYQQKKGGVEGFLSVCLKDTPALWLKQLSTLMGTNATSDITDSGSHSFLFHWGCFFDRYWVNSQCHNVVAVSS